MKLIKLPIKFYKEVDKDEVELIKLGLSNKEAEYEDGHMHVNVDQIIAFNKDSDGLVNLLLADGFGHKVYIEFEEFLELVKTL